jgi:tRNA pseudouridine32 synthase/23S rRNA pseudouridine746 synthase
MIHPYPSDIAATLPETFTDPFRYRPHPLVAHAAESVIRRIRSSAELSEIFAEGKMMGVLAVAYGPDHSQVGYLAGFSGLAGGQAILEGFVPPIYDLTDPKGYFKTHEAEISSLNAEISRLSSSEELKGLRQRMQDANEQKEMEMAAQKARMADLKVRRDKIRSEGTDTLRDEELTRQSQFEKAQLRRLKMQWEDRLHSIRTQIDGVEGRIAEMKRMRKEMSDHLQEWIFSQYRVHNYNGEEMSVLDIFKADGLVPPGGTGDCAAPKLLEYAYRNGMKPLAMGEFWYGLSPDTAVRTEGNFYPSCTSKCGPLLGYMTRGLDIIKEDTVHGSPEIIFEDEDIIAVHKPSGMPSVPGLNGATSLLEWLSGKTGCSTIESVHRLDMDTYGLMIFAKNPKAGQNIRKQFEEHTVHKTYCAILSSGCGKTLEKGDEGIISLPLGPDYDERPRQKADLHQGKEAVTRYHVDEILPDGCIRISFYPHTGRTHQLRVHSAHHLGLGHPIMGDLLYGGAAAPHLCLHATEIQFTHPTTGKPFRISI